MNINSIFSRNRFSDLRLQDQGIAAMRFDRCITEPPVDLAAIDKRMITF